MVNIWLDEDYDEGSDASDWMLPRSEAIGKVFQYDIGGHFGKRLGELMHFEVIQEDGDDYARAKFKDLFTGDERVFKQFGRAYCGRIPFTGSEYEVYLIEERDTDGWSTVRTQIQEPSQIKHMRLERGDNQYRVTSRKYVQGLGEYSRHKIRVESLEDPIVGPEDITNEESYRRMVQGIDEDALPDNDLTVIGEMWFDIEHNEGEKEFRLVWFNINREYQSRTHASAVETIENTSTIK